MTDNDKTSPNAGAKPPFRPGRNGCYWCREAAPSRLTKFSSVNRRFHWMCLDCQPNAKFDREV